jgi:SPP1 gp7 family putative phage head morphogenesis protein
MMNSEGLTFRINAFEMETLQWVKKLRDENLEAFTANTLRSMAQGESLAEVMENFTGLVEKRKNHAKFLARTQIANFNSLTTKLRAENIGITKAVWVTSRDERVRASHQARDGKKFELKKGLYSSLDGKWLLPGTNFQCRCDYILLIPGEEEETEQT